MKSELAVTFCLCLFAYAGPVSAQEPGASHAPQNVDLRAVEGHRVSPQGGGRVEEREGWLVLDSQARQFRLEVGLQVFTIAYDRITALHSETSREASKWGWPLKNTKHYMTIHYADADGNAAFETVSLSGRDISWVLDAVEKDAGLSIDRALARRSFLGIPIRAAIGDFVLVTDEIGNAVEGTITELSASTLAVEGPTGARQVFNGSSVSTITRTRSPGRDAGRGLMIWGSIGAVIGGLFGHAMGGDALSTFQGAAMLGAIHGSMGALVAAAVPSYRHRATRDIYLRSGPAGSNP
jgi:hypothetical protein